jgi:hypothetical protein
MEADKCPKCGKEMTRYQTFCGFCGYSRNSDLNTIPNQPQGKAIFSVSDSTPRHSMSDQGTKLLAAFMALSLIAVGGMLIAALNNFSTLDDQLSMQYEHNLKTIMYLDGMKINLTSTHLYLTDYVTGSHLNASAGALAADLQMIQNNSYAFTLKISVYHEDLVLSASPELMALLQTTGDSGLSSQEISHLDALSSNWLTLMTEVDEIIRLSIRTPISIANQTLIFHHLSDATGNFTKTEGSLDDIVSIRGEVSKIADDEAHRAYGDVSSRMILYSALIAIVLVVFMIAGFIEMRRKNLKKH